jgi:hypothetical protein
MTENTGPSVNTVEKIRESLAYNNLVEALVLVFGERWAEGTIYPDANPHDFEMTIDIDGELGAAYVGAVSTYMSGMWAAGPGGFVTASVPVSYIPRLRFVGPDKRYRVKITDTIGTDDEKREYRWGALGKDVDDIVGLLRILERYLAQRGDSEGQS